MIFVEDPTFADEMARDPEVRALVRATAEDVADGARSIAPRGRGWRGRRHYADSIEVDDRPGGGARVLTTDYFGHLVEYGSVNNPAYAPLRRAVDAEGLDFDEDPG